MKMPPFIARQNVPLMLKHEIYYDVWAPRPLYDYIWLPQHASVS